jgi:hypothetical protein
MKIIFLLSLQLLLVHEEHMSSSHSTRVFGIRAGLSSTPPYPEFEMRSNSGCVQACAAEALSPIRTPHVPTPHTSIHSKPRPTVPADRQGPRARLSSSTESASQHYRRESAAAYPPALSARLVIRTHARVGPSRHSQATPHGKRRPRRRKASSPPMEHTRRAAWHMLPR